MLGFNALGYLALAESLAEEYGTAFQPDAFQSDAFQIAAEGNFTAPTGGGTGLFLQLLGVG